MILFVCVMAGIDVAEELLLMVMGHLVVRIAAGRPGGEASCPCGMSGPRHMIHAMAPELEPLEQFRGDVEQAARNRVAGVKAWVSKWLSAQLLSLIGASGVFVGLAWKAFPYAVAAGVTLVIALLAIYAVYVRRQLAHERALRRWAWVQGKRMKQDVLKRELSMAEATLILAGQPQDRRSRFNLHTPGGREFVAAVRHVESRIRAAAVAQRPQPARATHRRPAESAAPDVTEVRRRREELKGEIAVLDAEIQALATPDAVDVARAAEEATRSHRELRDAAHEADRVARQRLLTGRKPSPATAELPIELTVKANGARDVRMPPPARTPEQIVRGQQPAPPTTER